MVTTVQLRRRARAGTLYYLGDSNYCRAQANLIFVGRNDEWLSGAE